MKFPDFPILSKHLKIYLTIQAFQKSGTLYNVANARLHPNYC